MSDNVICIKDRGTGEVGVLLGVGSATDQHGLSVLLVGYQSGEVREVRLPHAEWMWPAGYRALPQESGR